MYPEVAGDLPPALHVLTGAFLGVEIRSAETVPELHPGCQREPDFEGVEGGSLFWDLEHIYMN